MGVARAVIEILEPYVGRMVADTCIRGTAISLGKTSGDLCAEDLPTIEGNVRRILSPIAPASTVDVLVERIKVAAE